MLSASNINKLSNQNLYLSDRCSKPMEGGKRLHNVIDTSKQSTMDTSECPSEREFSLTLSSYLDIGGQNKLYRGVMQYKIDQSEKELTNVKNDKIEIVTKTALCEKNTKFTQYLLTEFSIMTKLMGVAGVIPCHGIKKITNPFNGNKEEEHLVLKYAEYGSLH